MPQKGNASAQSSPKNIKKAAAEAQPEDVSQKATQPQGDLESHAQTKSETQTNGEEYENIIGDEEEEGGIEAIGSVDEEGNVVDKEGNVLGHVPSDKAAELKGSMVDQEGDVVDEEGNVIGKADLEGEAAEAAGSAVEGVEKPDVEGAAEGVDKPNVVGAAEGAKPELATPFGVQDNGEITSATSDVVGTAIAQISEEGNMNAESGSTIGKAEISPELLEKAGEVGSQVSDAEKAEGELPEGEAPEGEKLEELEPKPEDAEGTVEGAAEGAGGEVPEVPDLSILKNKIVNKAGKIVDENGNPFGQLVEGDAKKLIGKKVDAKGDIWNDSGKIIGKAELLPDQREAEPSAPFEDFPDSIVDAKGNIIFEGNIVGKLIEGDAKQLEGQKVDADGDILDKNGNVLGKAERYREEEEIPEEPEVADLSMLEGKKVNKAGNVVDENGKLFGRIVTGDIKRLIGRKVDAEGKVWSDSGKVIGTAELIPEDEKDEDAGGIFEDFPNAIVNRHGNILYEGQIVGKLIDGDAKKLVGKKIDKDGEVVDRLGNILGRAERWIEEDEPVPEKVDMSALAGKRVNKVGNVVDFNGQIYGRIVSGDPKRLAGKMCDKEGNVWDEGGNIVGKAELVPESEREGQKEGPFADFEGCIVTKDGKVQDAKGIIIGRLIEGDAKKLYGRQVDSDGDVLDRNGNTIGKAERWEEEEKEKPHNPVAGRKVNREGSVVDENGDVIAKLTEGVIAKCSGKEIDEDGDVYNLKGQVIGHVTLLDDIPPEPEPEPSPEPEPQETEEEKKAKKQLEQDKKLANQMAMCLQHSLDKISPILKMITDAIDAAERQPKEELDEQKLVDTVKPLIEQGGQILQEANGVIRGLDPDGRIAANAKYKTAAREATPEEYRLADVLKELTGNVTQTIEQAKKKIAGMPHAKKEINPLWALLAEPLGQILAAVGLLLAGVLGLVGRLLSGLGLGGLLDSLLGGLGLKSILKGLGLGIVTESLTGKKN